VQFVAFLTTIDRSLFVPERLSKSLLYTYGTADLFFVVMINMEAYFFAAFLTDYAKFSLVIAGNILGVTSLIDIACALLGGVLLQKVTLKFGGKYRSWFLIGPPLVAPLFVLQFTKIGNDLTAALIVMFGFITSHLLFNVVVSASGGMLGRLSQLPDERTKLSASRAQGMAAGSLIFSATAMPLVVYFGAQTNKVAGFTITVALYSLLMILGYWFVYRTTAGRDPYDEAGPNVPGTVSSPSAQEIVSLVFRNPPLMILIFSQVFSGTSLFVITAMAIYYFRYVAGDGNFLSIFLLAISIARLIGTFAAPLIGVKLGKRNSYFIFVSLTAFGFAAAQFLSHSPWAFTLMCCLSSLFASVPAALNTALFADTVVYGHWKTGRNIRAFTMALMNLPIKVGILIRSAVVTAGLMTIGFVANATPTPRVVQGISSMMTLVPAAGYAIAAVIFFLGYKLDEPQVLEMQEEIKKRFRIPDS
jgi:Na+/melibiose symporter-like transporter